MKSRKGLHQKWLWTGTQATIFRGPINQGCENERMFSFVLQATREGEFIFARRFSQEIADKESRATQGDEAFPPQNRQHKESVPKRSVENERRREKEEEWGS